MGPWPGARASRHLLEGRASARPRRAGCAHARCSRVAHRGRAEARPPGARRAAIRRRLLRRSPCGGAQRADAYDNSSFAVQQIHLRHRLIRWAT